MHISIGSIFGVNVGMEFLPHEQASMMDPEAKWGLLLDILFVRVMYMQF